MGHWLGRVGFGEDKFLLILAFIIGGLAGAAAVGFHELIVLIRAELYERPNPRKLYGPWIGLLVLIPAAGGLAVGILTNYVIKLREGHGLIDVLESVSRSSGVIDPRVAFERILTSAITIGTGGSAGAEGPIVQIGAGIASGVGQLFRVARQHMPVLIGCGAAAGISAIFNSPIGGVLFALEVVLRDFSIRTFTPVVVASVISNFATQTIFRQLLGHEYGAIFTLPKSLAPLDFRFGQLGYYLLLGMLCGLHGVLVTRMMLFSEHWFAKWKFWRAGKPAVGGALLGVIGVVYVMLFGWGMGRDKFIAVSHYAMPAFFGDGYGAVTPMLGPDFYVQGVTAMALLGILAFIAVAKIVGTCLTLGSGGAGGIIAPSLFLGALTGAMLGLLLQAMGLSHGLGPHAYALVGMGAVLAAVVHAPLAAILITFEVTRDYQIILPSMLACIIATSVAQVIFRDSIYTAALRQRGVRLGNAADLTLLQRLSVEQVDLEPATVVRDFDPFQRVLDLTAETGATDFVVLDRKGLYIGMVTAEDIRSALLERDAVPLLTVSELMRLNVPVVRNTDPLALVLDTFARYELSRLPVTLRRNDAKVIGLISRAALMRRYQKGLNEGV